MDKEGIEMSGKLTLNKYHSYDLDGKYMPGVSSILKAAGLVSFDGIPEEILVRARDFGTAVNAACEFEDLGTLDMATVDEPVIPYLTAWQRFKRDTAGGEADLEIEDIELPVYSAKWWVAGKLDRIVILDGKRTLIDIKSSASVYPSMRIQLAGYKLLYTEMTGEKIKGRLIVQLIKDGSYRLTPCNDESDEQVFLACVQIAKFKQKEAKYYGGKR